MFLLLRFVKNHPTEQVQSLIRKEFERNKNESRPEVVEVAEHIHLPCSPHHANSRGFFQNLKSNAAAALTHYLFYVTPRHPFPPFTFMLCIVHFAMFSYSLSDFHQGRQIASCQRIQVRLFFQTFLKDFIHQTLYPGTPTRNSRGHLKKLRKKRLGCSSRAAAPGAAGTSFIEHKLISNIHCSATCCNSHSSISSKLLLGLCADVNMAYAF